MDNNTKPATASKPGTSAGGHGSRPGGGGRPGGRGAGGGSRGPRRDREEKEFDQRNLALDRVTRVTKGGKRMRFRACVIIGDHKGRVGYGVAKAADVQQTLAKAYTQAKKRVMTVPLVEETIPHAVEAKFGAAFVIMKPAPKGTGIKAGGAMRVVLEMAGVPNVVGKIIRGANKINITKATIACLEQLRRRPAAAVKAAPAVKA